MFSALMRTILHGFGTAHSSIPGWSWKSATVWPHVVSCFGDANKSVQDDVAPLKKKNCGIHKWLKNTHKFLLHSLVSLLIVVKNCWSWLMAMKSIIGIITVNHHYKVYQHPRSSMDLTSWSRRPLLSVEWCDPGRCSYRLRRIHGRIWRCWLRSFYGKLDVLHMHMQRHMFT